MKPQTNVALIVGVTGMAGLAIAEALKKPSAPGSPWKVYGTARRGKPSWFPDSVVDDFIAFDASDAQDTSDKLSSMAGEVTHVFWVALQMRMTEDANIAVNSTMLSNVLNLLTSAPSSRLCHIALQTGTKHYMGPIFDPVYGTQAQTQLLSEDPPFREDTPRLPYPNFYYALEDVATSYAPAITWSVHRPTVIVGASSRSVFNMLLTFGAYAMICRREGLPFRFPGSKYQWEHFCDMSDVRLLAEQQIWAATTDKAKNQAFNCTNGDVLTWKSLWKVFCEIYELEFVPFVPMGEKEYWIWANEMKAKDHVWDAIVEEHQLCKTKYSEFTSFEVKYAYFNIRFQNVSCMNKSRDLGFFGYVDTLKSIRGWIDKLTDMKILPKV